MSRGLAWLGNMAALGSIVALAACGIGADEAFGVARESDANSHEGDPEFRLVLARGISIDEVEINQGTRIPIGADGDWLDETQRLGHLIAGRDALLRVHFTVDEGWVPREIEARLTLGLPDGTSRSLSTVAFIEGNPMPGSNFGSLEGALWFSLDAAGGHTAAGTTYQIELWETSSSGDALVEGRHTNPAAGPRPIGFEVAPLQIKVVLVPIEFSGKVANLSAEIQAMLIDRLYEQNPVTEVLWEVHDPVVHAGNLNSLGALLPVLVELRNAEQADPNVYYHAFLDVGGAAYGGLSGISAVADDQRSDAANRVSATVLWSVNPALAAETFVHETGHAQGLHHVDCPNTEAATPDASYPHADGRIGNAGFGVRRFVTYGPTDAFDYMSYCGPSWTSDWTWNKTYERIATLTAWDFEVDDDDPQLDAREVLVGAIYPDGSREWWTRPGGIARERVSGRDRFVFETLAGEIIEGWGAVALLSDGVTQWVEVELPVAPAQLAGITHLRGEQLTRVDPAFVR
jgi:hypothetical protein